MKFKGNNKVQTNMETVLVATASATPTGSLVDATTALNIANGAVAVLSFDLDGTPVAGDFVTAANAGASTNNAVKLIQGTPKSSAIHTVDPWQVSDPATVESDVIFIDNILDYSKVNASFGNLAGDLTTYTGTIEAGKTYSAEIYLNSVKGDRDFGDNDEVIHEQFDTPVDLTGITDTTDYVLNNLIFKFNTRSKLANVSNSASIRRGNRDFVVLGLNTSAGAGTVINTVAEGASVNILNDNGTITALTITNEIVTTLAKLKDAGDIAGTETIEVVNVSTAGNAANIDAFLVLGLDQDQSVYFDDIAQVRTSVTVNLGDQFRTDGVTQASVNPVEAVGSARREGIAADDRYQLRVHTKQNHPHGEFFSKGVSYIVDGTWYNNAIVSFYDYEETLTVRPRYHKRVVLLWSAVPAAGTTVATAATAIGASNAPIVFTSTEPAAVAAFEAWKDR